MMEDAEDKLVQLRADILRMMLLYKYGGMWMDANSIFLRSLEWVD
jgi:mannosyltransferase OCH1-like enzyme